MNIASFHIKQIATEAINKAITEKIAEDHESDKLMDWKMDKNGDVTGFMLNYMEHLKITAETVDVVQRTLDELRKVPNYVPVGQALDSAILATYGPDIKIKFVPEGTVKVDLNTRERNVGINNTLVEVYIRVITEVAIHIPFETGSEIVETEIPISYLLVVGDVPMYYFDNKGQPTGTSPSGSGVIPPTISLPSLDNIISEEGQTDIPSD